MARRTVVGKTPVVGEEANGSLEGRIGSVSAEEAVAAGKGFHVPRPILYVGLGITVLAIAAGVALAASQPWRNKDNSGGVGVAVTQTVTPPYAQPTATAQAPVPGMENVMSAEQVKATLEEIVAFRRQNGVEVGQAATNNEWQNVTPEDREIWKKVEQTNKTVYFMLTGRTFEQDKFVTRIVRKGEQVPNISERWRNRDGTFGAAGTIAYLPDGTLEIYVSGTPTIYANSSRMLILLLANETGNALDERLVNSLADRLKPPHERSVKFEVTPEVLDDYYVHREAAKSLYQAANLHLMKDVGVKGLSVADTPRNREQIRLGLERSIIQSAYPSDGWLLGWWYALNDTDAKQELEVNGELNSVTAFKLHDKVMKDLLSTNYVKLVRTVMGIKDTLKQPILETLYKRLKPQGEITDVLPGDATYLFVP